MFRSILFSAPVLVALAFAPCAHATSIFVYDLSGASFEGFNLSGSITIEGNDGAAVPLLDSSSVLSWNFSNGIAHWESDTAEVQADNMSFNGTLGDATLNGASGQWQVFYGPESNAYQVLYGSPGGGPPFGEPWGWCTSTQNCGLVGLNWKLTLESETPEAPEPSTAALMMGVAAAFGVTRARRIKRA